MSSNGESDAFVRWQGFTIAQLTQAVSVVLGLAVAALGFDVNLLVNKEFLPVSWQKCAFAIALAALLLSVGIGIWCMVNRLRDFRATMAVNRKGANASDVADKRALADRLGERTWKLFWGQISTFGVGIASTVVGVVGVYGNKLL